MRHIRALVVALFAATLLTATGATAASAAPTAAPGVSAPSAVTTKAHTRGHRDWLCRHGLGCRDFRLDPRSNRRFVLVSDNNPRHIHGHVKRVYRGQSSRIRYTDVHAVRIPKGCTFKRSRSWWDHSVMHPVVDDVATNPHITTRWGRMYRPSGIPWMRMNCK